jgi:hypothetical protein
MNKEEIFAELSKVKFSELSSSPLYNQLSSNEKFEYLWLKHSLRFSLGVFFIVMGIVTIVHRLSTQETHSNSANRTNPPYSAGFSQPPINTTVDEIIELWKKNQLKFSEFSEKNNLEISGVIYKIESRDNTDLLIILHAGLHSGAIWVNLPMSEKSQILNLENGQVIIVNCSGKVTDISLPNFKSCRNARLFNKNGNSHYTNFETANSYLNLVNQGSMKKIY